jgi:penicillin-binding protein-related factor A (putative recombinase)
MKPESRLQKKIKEHLKKTFGGVWHKIHGGPFQNAGIGDLVGCCKGYYFNLEVKQDKPGKKYEPTEIQQGEIDEINQEGGCGACVKSVEQAEYVVKTYLEQKSVFISKESSKSSNETKISRTVDGARNRKNSNSIKNSGELVQKRLRKKSPNLSS